MVGGDFNTEQNRGWRGDRLEELLCETDLEVCNKSSILPFRDLWTCQNILGARRVLDYCLVSVGIQMQSSKAIDDLDLRSDHRAKQTCLLLPPEIRPAPKRKKKRRINWDAYRKVAQNVSYIISNDLPYLEKEVLDIARRCEEDAPKIVGRPWDSEELQLLRARRRSAESPGERKVISKLIWRTTRQQLRRHRTMEGEKKLQEFSKLESLQRAHLYPIQKKHTLGPNLEACAKLLQQVYTTENAVDYSNTCNVPTFTIDELKQALRKMRKGRCDDKDGINLEMFLHSGPEHLESLLVCLYNVLVQDTLPSSWRETFFSLLHKGGCVEDVKECRPIAILSTSYNIFARLVHDRIQHQLLSHQSEDQFGFRPGRSTTDALLILESMLSKGVEFNVPVFVMIID